MIRICRIFAGCVRRVCRRLRHDRGGRHASPSACPGGKDSLALLARACAGCGAIYPKAFCSRGHHHRHGAGRDGLFAGRRTSAARMRRTLYRNRKPRSARSSSTYRKEKEPLLDVRQDAPRRAGRRACWSGAATRSPSATILTTRVETLLMSLLYEGRIAALSR